MLFAACHGGGESAKIQRNTDLSAARIEHIAPVDASHAIVSFSIPGQDGRVSIAFVEVGSAVAAWSLTPPCDPRAGVEVTAAPDAVTVFCARAGGATAVAMGFDVTSGRTMWTSDDVPLHGERHLDVRRERGTVLEWISGRYLVARDPRTGNVRWSAGEHLETVVGTNVLTQDDYREVVVRDLPDGKQRLRVKGLYCGASDDAVFYSRFTDGHFDGIVAAPFDGAPPRLVALASILPAAGSLWCGTYRGDLVVLREPEKGRDKVLVRVHDGQVAARGELPSLIGVPQRAGWDRVLPRFVPTFSWDEDTLVILDLESATIARRARYSVRGEHAAWSQPGVLERVGDRFLLADDRGCRFIVDGTTGRAAAPAACAKVLAIKDAATWGLGARGGIAGAELGEATELALTLNGHDVAPP